MQCDAQNAECWVKVMACNGLTQFLFKFQSSAAPTRHIIPGQKYLSSLILLHVITFCAFFHISRVLV